MTSDAQILTSPAGAGEGADPRRWLTLAILLLAAFMNLLDVSIVNIAIPSIQRDLNASYADVQWALAGYTLAYALVLITGGRLGDTFGRKRLFLIGVTGFTIMSALCGAAQSPGQLIAFRVVQGAMGAIMVPQVFALFVWYERIKDRRDGSPLVPPRLFRERGFSAGMAIAVTFFMGIASFGLVLTLFLQLGLGFTPLHAGLTFLPFSVGVLISSGAAARLAPRFGRGVTMAGALIIAAGMAGIIATVHHYGAAVTTWELVPGLVAAGLGLGAVIAPLADIVLDRVPKQDAGSASGVFNTGLQLGNSIGIAVIGVIFFGIIGSQSGPAASN